MVDDLDNGSEPAGVGTGAEEDDTADLDVPPGAGSNCCRHFDCGCRGVVLRFWSERWFKPWMDMRSRRSAGLLLTVKVGCGVVGK